MRHARNRAVSNADPTRWFTTGNDAARPRLLEHGRKRSAMRRADRTKARPRHALGMLRPPDHTTAVMIATIIESGASLKSP